MARTVRGGRAVATSERCPIGYASEGHDRRFPQQAALVSWQPAEAVAEQMQGNVVIVASGLAALQPGQ